MACLIIGNIFYFLFCEKNYFIFLYKKLKIIFKISLNKNNFLELKQTLI